MAGKAGKGRKSRERQENQGSGKHMEGTFRWWQNVFVRAFRFVFSDFMALCVYNVAFCSTFVL